MAQNNAKSLRKKFANRGLLDIPCGIVHVLKLLFQFSFKILKMYVKKLLRFEKIFAFAGTSVALY